MNHSASLSSPGSEDLTHQLKEGPAKRLCRSRQLGLRVFYLSFLWFTLNIVYYGIGFGLGKLQGDIYINGMISGGSQALAYLVSGFLMTVMGRRDLTLLSFILTGVPLSIYGFIDANVVVSYILVLIGKFGISSCFNVIFIWSVQLFPTQVKGIALGFCNFFGRVGGIVAPLLSGVLPHWFLLIFGVLSIISAAICLLLSETKGMIIPDVIDESSSIVMRIEEN